MLTFTLEKSKYLSNNVPFVGFKIYLIVEIESDDCNVRKRIQNVFGFLVFSLLIFFSLYKLKL